MTTRQRWLTLGVYVLVVATFQECNADEMLREVQPDASMANPLQGGFYAIAFTSDARELITSVSDDNSVVFFDIAKHQVTRILRGHEAIVKTVREDPKNKSLLTACSRGFLKQSQTEIRAVIRRWDLASDWETYRRVVPGMGEILCSSPNATLLASKQGRSRTAVILVDAASGKRLATPQDERMNGTVNCATFSTDGTLLAIGGGYGDDYQGEISIWDQKKSKIVTRIQTDGCSVRRMAFAANGEIIAACGDLRSEGRQISGGLEIWDIKRRERLRFLPQLTSRWFQFSPDGRFFSVSHGDGIDLWCMKSKNKVLILKHSRKGVFLSDHVFAADGSKVAATSSENDLTMWRIPAAE